MHPSRLLLPALLLLSATFTAGAQTGFSADVELMARIDFQQEWLDGNGVYSEGFRGRNLSVLVTGKLNEHFSYRYRQRLYRAHGSGTFFDATDHLYLTYAPDEHWSISAGKQSVMVGGFEYDLTPIDIYYLSEYCSNVICYRFGVSAGYSFNGGNDQLTAQWCQSPAPGGEVSLYAYNLMWTGHHGPLNTLWSANLVEYFPGKFVSYLALGTSLQMGKFSCFLDVMNRSDAESVTLFRDYTLTGKLTYSLNDSLRIFAKASHDCNNLEQSADWCVLPGTSISRAGGGVEYFPLKDGRLRLHATYCCGFGTNGNETGVVLPNQQIANVGLTWYMKI